MKKIAILFIFLTLFGIKTQCFADELIINNQHFYLEEAISLEQKALGLMYRNNLPLNEGMIFKYSPPEEVGFWMKNMKISLDILFIFNEKIVKINRNTLVCKKNPCKIYYSDTKIDSVIELNAGICDKFNIKKGQPITLRSKK
ncbi:MAG: DUF192 domain-containing protein [Candidatus Gastranaerophilales bacterium]|nr:DUF192 domain-containing protein [Candidatus Gastranaerophilales bacterium]